jgi:hypothetical protein
MADHEPYRPRHESAQTDPFDDGSPAVVWVPVRPGSSRQNRPDSPPVAAVTPEPEPEVARRRGLPGPVVAFGVLLVEAAFIASYVGGLHAPVPKNVPVAVVASATQVGQLSSQLGAASSVVRLKAEPTRADAIKAIDDRVADGGYLPATGELLVASGRGPALTAVLTPIFTTVATKTGAKLHTTDVAPLPPQDSRGLVSFYLVIGWIVGGYLLAAVLGILAGMTPKGLKAAFSRILTMAGYAVASGIAGAAVVDTGFGYATGHFWPLAGLGALLVFAVGVITMGLESILGLVGTTLAIVLFVVAGNPSAGGPWPIDMSPRPWRQIGPYLPNGAGVTTSRQILFFGDHAISMPLIVLAAYAAVGIVFTLLLVRRGRPLINLTGR